MPERALCILSFLLGYLSISDFQTEQELCLCVAAHAVLCLPLAHPRFGLIYPSAGRQLSSPLAVCEF